MGILSICTLMYLKHCLCILRAFRLSACGHIHSIAWHSKGIFLWMHKSAIAFWCRVQNCGVGLSGYIVCVCNCTCCNQTIPRRYRGWKQDEMFISSCILPSCILSSCTLPPMYFAVRWPSYVRTLHQGLICDFSEGLLRKAIRSP